MSHVASVELAVNDLDCLERALAKICPGAKLHRGRKNWRWYGRWMNDYDGADAAYKLGIKPEDYGKGDHVVTVPGSDYDIGLMPNPKGKGWVLVYDFYGHNGRKIAETFGHGLEKLKVEYGVERTRKQAKKQGLSVKEERKADGSVKLTLTRSKLGV